MNCKTLVNSFLLILCVSGLSFGHEVDQYDLPECEQFEDLGEYWNQTLHEAVCKGVCSLNREIELVEGIPIPGVRDLLLARLHSPDTIGWRVRRHLPSALFAIEGLEWKMRLGLLPKKHEDRIQSHRPSMFDTSFNHFPLLPDPRQINRLLFMRASLLKVHDKYIGSDKIGHFIGMGYLYYLTYRAQRLAGECHEDAVSNTVQIGKYGPISENFLVGMIPTGIYSNGDMAANYLGMKFFISLTNPVTLQGCQYPPMLERDGNYWRIRPHVTPEGEYYAAFVSEHMDEVLNPSIIEPFARDQWRERIRERVPQVLAWYAGNDSARLNPRYFEEIRQRCTTYFGEDYGHSGDEDQLLTVAELCFDDSGRPAIESEDTTAQLVSTSTQAMKHEVNVDVLVPEAHLLNRSEIYAIVVQNPADATVESVTFTVQIPEGLHVTVVDRPARFDRETNSLTWRIGEFEPGAEQVFNVTARAVKVGSYRWEVSVKDGDRLIGAGAYQTIVSEKLQKVDSVADLPVILSPTAPTRR